MSESDKIEGINNAFASEGMKIQISSWREQEVHMRQTVCELWEDGVNFGIWWRELNNDAKTALVLTALEDLPQNSSFASLIDVVSPELKESPTLLKDEEALIQLLSRLMKSRENDEDVFNLSTYLAEFSSSNTSLSPATEQALKLARSCILLQFATAVLLVYSNEQTENS